MTMSTKNNIFDEYQEEYLKANKKEKGKILDHVCFVTKIHRKSAIQRFKDLQHPKEKKKRGRKTFYTIDTTIALKELWRISSHLCGELLHPIVREYVEILQRDELWSHNEETTEKLLLMSESTVKRRISNFVKIKRKKKGLSSTKPSLLKEIIPIFNGPWKEKSTGYGQVDTIVHCGSSLLGDMAYSLNFTDVSTLWIILRAQWNKGQLATRENMEYVKDNLPFPFLGAHPDTGSEFINWHLKNWCDENGIELTRSRPNRKNDNMHVEERNGHVIRKYLGYVRLDCRDVVEVLNELYEVLCRYLNHFIPVRRCLEKKRVGSKYVRKYEKISKTPYQRVLERDDVSDTVKSGLKEEHSNLNPLLLKTEIDRLVKKVYDVQKNCCNL
jgi:hypothetical protein